MASSLFFANGNQSLGTPSSFTVAAWVNGGQNNNAGYVVTYGSLNAGISWTIQYGYGYVIFNTPSKTVQYSYDSSPFHVAVTYDNGVANMYVNGDPVTSSSCTISYVNPSYL
nr:LamG domain-containing protein [Sulfuracidifex metallicus]